MAKSTQITNRDATPATFNTAGFGAPARLREAYASITTTTSDTTGTKYVMLEVPAQARLGSLQLQAAAGGTGSSVNVGLYRNTQDGGAVVSTTFFTAAIAIATAVAPTEIKHMSGTYDITKQGQPLWQAAGVTTDPGNITYDIVAVSTTTIDTGALLGLKAQYAL